MLHYTLIKQMNKEGLPVKKMLILLMLAVMLIPGAVHADADYAYALTPLHGASANRIHNVERAASLINGTVLQRGAVFSFNDIVGPRSSANGFKREKNGVGVEVIGGGVSQVATTLDLALKEFDGNIHFLERHVYGKKFLGDYVKHGENAVRVEYSGAKNYAFTDNHQTIRISMFIEGMQLHCEVKGEGYSGDGEMPPLPPPARMGEYYARLVSFDPNSFIGQFDDFQMLRGAEAVKYLVKEKGYTLKDAKAEVADYGDSEYIEVNTSHATVSYNLSNTNFSLMYQPNGEQMPGAEGVPSTSGDFLKLWQHNPSLLLDSYFFRVHDKNGEAVYVEQVYWP